MWRAAIVLLVADKARLSVPLDIFLVASGFLSLHWKVISDANPWRLAAGLYDYESGRLLCWSTFLLPYSSANAHRFQTQREYLGHLFSLLLIVADKATLPINSGTSPYQWVNDNTGTISWVNKNKCSSSAGSFACMAISQLNMLSNVWAAESIHIPGSAMGEIDAMSRLEAQSDHLLAFPTLTPATYVDVQSPPVTALFERCNHGMVVATPAEHHTLFSDVSTLIHNIIASF